VDGELLATALEREEADPRYQAALSTLRARGRFGIRLGLSRTRAMLRRLADPQTSLPGVLIGGTNGKGSVQAMVAAALAAAGYRVGQTPKPHLLSYRERILVDGRPIPVADFAALIQEVSEAARRVAPRLGPPTEFEVLTAAAFEWFRRSAVEIGVIEVGMGGRLDATNVWQGGISAITNVALDHTEYLGSTVSAIAREKAHIIKRGDRFALTGAENDALAVIRRRAGRVGVPLRVVQPLEIVGMDRSGVHLRRDDGSRLTVALLGRHQAANASLALAIIDALAEAGMARVTDEQIAAAFAGVRWPGRLELVSRPLEPDVLLDGAHNPHGMAALAAALDELLPILAPGRPTLLLGVLGDHKDVPAMLEPLRAGRALATATVLTTTVPDSPRSLPAASLAAAWGAGARAIDDPTAALEEARRSSRREGGPLVISGSLYLVGYLRGRLAGAGGGRPPPTGS
jgi:dihydrofolate synthase / folylpolyglutamate synthase